MVALLDRGESAAATLHDLFYRASGERPGACSLKTLCYPDLTGYAHFRWRAPAIVPVFNRPAMLFRLVVEKKGKRARVVEIRSGAANIGRAHGNEVRIPASDVSRRHCEVKERDGLLWVEDLDSVNGTYLNGDLITGKAVIRPGDRLDVGPVTFVVEYELTPKALKTLQAEDYEVVEEVVEVAELDEEDFEVKVKDKLPKEKPGLQPLDEEEIEEVLEVEEEQAPLVDMEGATWTGQGDGDLRDLLTHLDEGQESLKPKKRPAPRKMPDIGGKKPPKKKE
jgi:pSer/pThr/pTyr-binding forkhead associated (FHA) protein